MQMAELDEKIKKHRQWFSDLALGLPDLATREEALGVLADLAAAYDDAARSVRKLSAWLARAGDSVCPPPGAKIEDATANKPPCKRADVLDVEDMAKVLDPPLAKGDEISFAYFRAWLAANEDRFPQQYVAWRNYVYRREDFQLDGPVEDALVFFDDKPVQRSELPE